MAQFNKTVLNNGVTVLTESHKDSLALCCGIFVDVGSRDEPSAWAGMTHFLEHLVFKGTQKRDAYDLARVMEAVGGEINAYTSRDNTCFHTLSLAKHWELSLDVLSDLVARATFPEHEFEREKQVVLHEIAMGPENLEEFIFDRFSTEVFPEHGLGRPIVGFKETVKNISLDNVREFYQKRYCGENLVVSATGNVDHEKFVVRVEELLGDVPSLSEENQRIKPEFQNRRFVETKAAEQAHLLLGVPSASFKDSLRFEAYVMNSLLGGGMTSRLYQEVREKKGLAYSIYSYLQTSVDSGLLCVYAGTEEKYIEEVLRICRQEMEQVALKGVSEEELELYKTQVLGSVLLGSEDMENRMNSIAVNDMVFKEYRSVQRVMEEIEQVSVNSMREYIDQHFDWQNMSVAMMGQVHEENLSPNWKEF